MKSDYRIFKKTLDIIGIKYEVEIDFMQEQMIIIKKGTIMLDFLVFVFSKDGKFKEVR